MSWPWLWNGPIPTMRLPFDIPALAVMAAVAIIFALGVLAFAMARLVARGGELEVVTCPEEPRPTRALIVVARRSHRRRRTVAWCSLWSARRPECDERCLGRAA